MVLHSANRLSQLTGKFDQPLNRGEVRAYLFSTPILNALQADASMVDSYETSRAARFATPWLRARYIATHIILRIALAGQLGCPPATQFFTRTTAGKPRLAAAEEAGISFSVSYSNSWGAVALAACADLGVDIELARTLPAADKLALSIMSIDELAHVPRVTSNDLLRRWTLKEALLKATGVGIGGGLREITLDFDADDAPFLRRFGSHSSFSDWSLHTEYKGPGIFLSIAALGEAVPMRYGTEI